MVAVVGRPNVGKSTLFNRLYGKRRAITDPTPGVTRDALEQICTLAGKEILLVDTGGIKVERDEHFDELVANKSLEKLKEASLILLVLEADGLTSEDETMIEHIRPYSERVIVVVNKVDHVEKDSHVWEFYNLGFEHVIGISAAHNRNIGELKECIVNRINEMIDQGRIVKHLIPDITMCILGKPNAGKSTLLNHLSGGERALVSPIAGTTRDIIEGQFKYKHKAFRVLDTAGIRKKKKVRENVEYYSVNRAIKAIEDSDVVLLMIDALEGLSDQDKKITTQIINKGRGVVMVLNKWDEIRDDPKKEKEIEERVRFLFPVLSFAPLIPISALDGGNIHKMLDAVILVQKQMHQRAETSQLNEALREWIDYNPIPYINRKSYKAKYLTQVEVNPPRFLLFVNRVEGFPEFYTRFIINQIRKEFKFNRVPLKLDLKENKKKER